MSEHATRRSVGIASILAILMVTVTVPVDSLDELTRWKVTETDTYELEFNETIDFISNKWLTQENMTLASTPEKIHYDAVICTWLQGFYSDWNCDERFRGIHDHSWAKGQKSSKDVLENEEYTFNGRIEYHYKLNHAGTVKVRETISSSQNQATTVTHEIIESNEVFNLSLKTSIVFEVHRRYTPVGHEHIIQTFAFEVPFPTLVDVDGDGTHRELGFNIPAVNTNKVYLWDNFTSVSNSTSLNGLGDNIDLGGRINLIEIDLLQFAGSVLSSLGAGAGIAGAINVLSYFIEIWLTLTLDIEFNMQTLAQINVANDVSTLQQSTDTHAERLAGSNPLGFNDGRTDDSVSVSNSETKQTNPTADDLLSGLSFVYIGDSTESYSINLEIRPSSKRVGVGFLSASLGDTLWAIKGWSNPIIIPLAQDLFSSSSTYTKSTMTSAVHTSSMPELPSLPPPNNAPQAGTSISATEVFTGQTITLDSSSSQDSDNDALETSVSWGDGSQSTWSSSSSFSHTYSVPGTYEISTKVRDNFVSSNTVTNTVVVTKQPYLGEVTLSSNLTQVEANESVSFTISLTNISNPDQVLVTLGDGTNQTLTSSATISHIYSSPGLSTISVVVKDGEETVSSILTIDVIPNSNPPAQIDEPGEVSAANYSEEGAGESVSQNSSTSSIGTEQITLDAGVEGAIMNMTGLTSSTDYIASVQLDVIIWNESGNQYEWRNLFYDVNSFTSQSSTGTWSVVWDHLWIENIHSVITVLYDSEGNPIANASIELDFEVPDLPQIEISDSGILLVIDTEGANYSAEPSLWNTSFENPTNGEETIFQASMTVAEITGQEFDLFYVGDTDRDGIFDSYGEDGPGLGILQQYQTVIWSTGPEYVPLSANDEFHLSTYVNSGGSLILFSQDYLWGACSECDTWNYSTFANRTLGISSSYQDYGLNETLTGNNGGGQTNIAYLLTAGLDSVDTRTIKVNGTVQPYEDVLYISDDSSYTLGVFSTYDYNTSSYETIGLSKMFADDDGYATGRLSFFAFDPAAMSNRYDLELLLMQSVNWSSQTITDQSTPELATPIYIGQDGVSAIDLGPMESVWYSIHPEPGRSFSLEFEGQEINDVALYDSTGTQKLATFTQSFSNYTWWINTLSQSSEVYMIKVENWNYATNNWIGVNSSYIEDSNPNCWDYGYDPAMMYPPNLIIDGEPVTDQLVPYLSQGPDYSGSCYEAYLMAGKSYAVTVELFGDFNSDEQSNDSLSIFMDVAKPDWSEFYLAESAPNSNILETSISPLTSGYFEISVAIYGYENPHLVNGQYQIHIWELPSYHTPDDDYSNASLLDLGYHAGWIDGNEDYTDMLTWEVFDGEVQDVWIDFDRTIDGLVYVEWFPDDENQSYYFIDISNASEGAHLEINASGMGTVFLTIYSFSGRANYSVIVEERLDSPIMPFEEIVFSEIGVVDETDSWIVEILPNLPVVVSFGTTDTLFNLSGAYSLNAWAVDPSGNMIYPNADGNFIFADAEGGNYQIHLQGEGGGYWLWAFIDSEPIVFQQPSTSVMAGETYETTFEAAHWVQSSTRGWYLQAALTYSIEEGPIGLTIDSLTGEISMVTGLSDVGTHEITILVESTWILPLRYSYNLTVNDQPNTPPVIDDILDIVVVEGGMVEFSVTATDAENDNLTIQLLNAPNGMILDQNTWEVWWAPLNSGSYNVDVKVDDARGATSTMSVTIIVYPVDEPIVRIQASATSWEGTEGDTAIIQVLVSLENSTSYDCSLDMPLQGQRVDDDCTIVWNEIPMGAHEVPVTVSSGLSQYGLMLSFDALELVLDNNETDTNSTNVDDLDDLEDDQEQDTDSEEDTADKTKDSSKSDGMSTTTIIGIGAFVLLVVILAVVLVRRKGSDPRDLTLEAVDNSVNHELRSYDDSVIPTTEVTQHQEPIQAQHQQTYATTPQPVQTQPAVVPTSPPINQVGQPDQHGYEWVQFNGENWYRTVGSGTEWTKWNQ